MPLFCPEFPDDEELIREIAGGVCSFWNKNGGGDFGVTVYTSDEAIRSVSKAADEVMTFFPEEPGPFKRVAALLVLARLEPLFSLAAPCSEQGENIRPASTSLANQWISKVVFLAIKPAFDCLTIPGTDGMPTALSDWRGFPSLHSKAEFLLFLDWMQDYHNDMLPHAEFLIRRGRMILAVSLILEATYYQDGRSANVCGLCDKALHEHLHELIFDAVLFANEQERLKTPLPITEDPRCLLT